MASTHSGLLFLYRWPPGTDWSQAPDCCHMHLRGQPSVTPCRIWHGHGLGKVQDPWSVELGTAVALVHIEGLSAAQADGLE